MDTQFYPTPAWLVDKMLEGIRWSDVRSALEPEAGKGDIALKIKAAFNMSKNTRCKENKIDLDCIEIEPNLRHILVGNKLRVVHDNFLTYKTMKKYDLIVMNPPFKDGDKHLLKAIDMQKRNGGSIVCILNAETIRNAYTNERKLLRQILHENDANIEFIEDAFVEAEVPTSVEIALIKVTFPKVTGQSIIINRLKHAHEHINDDDTYADKIVNADYLKGIVQEYEFEVNTGIALIKEYNAIRPYIMSMFESEENKTYLKNEAMLTLTITDENEYLKKVRRKYWNALFHNDKFTGQLTTNLLTEYYSKVSELEDYDFSLFNIYELKLQMLNSMSQAVESTIVSLFNELSYEHSYYDEYSNNIHYFNGWKTNKAHIINKKVIIPLQGFLDWLNNRYHPTQYYVIKKLEDIEKCMDYLDCGRTVSINLKKELEYAEAIGKTKGIKLKYFDVTFYKKGTCHITFTNDELLKKFNLFGCQRKGWLPPSYGKKTYNELSDEEKNVIDEFEGKDSYNETIRNSEYYICESNSLLLSA